MKFIDLSRLPPPSVIEEVDYETILQEMTESLLMLDPALTLVESDPSYKILQVAAYREMIKTQRDNEKIRSLMAAYAKGSELDHIGVTYYATPRLVITPEDKEAKPPVPAVMESDQDYLRRFLLAPDGWSTAGPRDSYIYHALGASPEVADVTAITTAPTEVLITVLAKGGNGSASQELIDSVYEAVNDEKIRPQTDLVTVESAEIIEFTINAALEINQGPDPEVVRQAAEASLVAFLSSQRRMGTPLIRDALLASLYVQGVQRVVIDLLEDITPTQQQAAICIDYQVSIA